jgi:hypothetical protein
LPVGDVEADPDQSGKGDRVGIARGRVNLAGAALQQGLGERQAEAAIGAGDKSNGIFYAHGGLLWERGFRLR